MKKRIIGITYYLSVMLPCGVTCWTLCFGSPDSVMDKVVLVLLTVACVACNAVLRHTAIVQSEAQNNLAREQSERIRYLQCHAQPTMQMVRDTALRLVQLSQEKGFRNNCDVSTRDFAAIASFGDGGSILHVERFMRVDDFDIARFYGSGGSDVDEVIRKFMFEDVPFPCGQSENKEEQMRRMGRFALKVAVPLYGVFDRCFFDEQEHNIWIMGIGGKQPLLTIDAQMQRALIGICRWDAYSMVVSWCAEAGLLSLRDIAQTTPFSKWTEGKDE